MAIGANLISPEATTHALPKSNAWLQCKEVVVPNGVVLIGERAFASSKLEAIDLPPSLEYIGDSAFSESELEDITLPNNLTYIGTSAFWSTGKGVASVPGGVRVINDAFQGSTFKSIVLAKGITAISDRAFWYCPSPESIDLPDTLVSIGCQAFQGCKKLRHISLPTNIAAVCITSFDGVPARDSLMAQASSYGATIVEDFPDLGIAATIATRNMVEGFHQNVLEGGCYIVGTHCPAGTYRVERVYECGIYDIADGVWEGTPQPHNWLS